jgi:hypothetical protein
VWVPGSWTKCCACGRAFCQVHAPDRVKSLNCLASRRPALSILTPIGRHHAGPPFHPLFWFLVAFPCLTSPAVLWSIFCEHLDLKFLVSMQLPPCQSR